MHYVCHVFVVSCVNEEGAPVDCSELVFQRDFNPIVKRMESKAIESRDDAAEEMPILNDYEQGLSP